MASNVLVIPPASGVAAPQSKGSRFDAFRGGSFDSQGTVRAAMMAIGCCPCPPQGQSSLQPMPQGPGPMGQPGGGLGQPPMSQKPFQFAPQTPCDAVDEMLARQGLSTKMLKDCLGSTRRTSPSKKRRAAPRRKAKTRAKAVRKTARSKKKAVPKAVSRSGSGRFKLFKRGTGIGTKSVCRDMVTNKFVKRSKCN